MEEILEILGIGGKYVGKGIIFSFLLIAFYSVVRGIITGESPNEWGAEPTFIVLLFVIPSAIGLLWALLYVIARTIECFCLIVGWL